MSVDETAASGQSGSFTAVLDTALGDFQSTQCFVCAEDSLVTLIRGDDQIGWQRYRAALSPFEQSRVVMAKASSLQPEPLQLQRS